MDAAPVLGFSATLTWEGKAHHGPHMERRTLVPIRYASRSPTPTPLSNHCIPRPLRTTADWVCKKQVAGGRVCYTYCRCPCALSTSMLLLQPSNCRKDLGP